MLTPHEIQERAAIVEQVIGVTQLRDGRQATLAVVQCPEPARAEGFSRLYCHKEEHWLWHVERSLVARLDELETRFHTARVDGSLTGCVVTTEHRSLGVVTHVFTEPGWRGNGICSSLLKQALKGFSERGGRIATLDTAYGGQAYRLYSRLGFESTASESGTMVAFMYEGALAEHVEQQWTVAPLAWRHWPGLCALVAMSHGGMCSKNWPGNPTQWFEGDFLKLMESVRRGEATARVLEGDQGGVMGIAFLERRWPSSDEHVLELWVQPAQWDQAEPLVRSLGDIPQPTRTYADEDPARLALLDALGFVETARVERIWGAREARALHLLQK
jgi:ribosomal protein S18 acetylase RimI-like enzyme